jgi:hypothetical protein
MTGILRTALAAAAVALVAAGAASAGSLEGRTVTLHVMTWDDPARPILNSTGRTVTVGRGVEFGMGPEHRTPGFDVVPVQVQIGPARIEFSYGAERGDFFRARFNGYVLRFRGDCALFARVAVDRSATTMAVTDADITADTGALFINVAGRSYGPDQRLALDNKVADCPLS